MNGTVGRWIVAMLSWATVFAQEAAQRAGPITREQKEVFALLDKFDPLDTSNLPFVMVATGSSHRISVGPLQNTYRYGFLVETKGKTFKVRYLDLAKATFEMTPRGAPEYARVGFEPVLLRAFAQKASQKRQERNKDAWKNPGPRWDFMPHNLCPSEPMPPTPLLLLLARACARRGMNAEVHALWEVLPEDHQSVEWLTVQDGGYWLAAGLATRLTLDFMDLSYSWQDLLARHDLWLETFPQPCKSKHVKARRTGIKAVLELERKLAEQAKNLAQDDKARMQKLVMGLRNERYPRQRFGGVSWEISPDEPKPKDGSRPVDRLRREGLKAVPALIEALGDKTLTRSVLYVGWKGAAFYIKPLGDLAEDALVEIAGGQPQTDWDVWYEKARSQGLRKTHAEMIDVNDWHALEAARKYLERWPEDLDVILAAVRGSDKSDQKSYQYGLVTLLAEHTQDPRITALLREEVEKAPELYARVGSAELLLDMGSKYGVPKILAEWEAAGQPKRLTDYEEMHSRFPQPRLMMLPFLLSSGDGRALRAVAMAMDSEAIRDLFLELLQRTHREQLVKHVVARDLESVLGSLEEILAGMLECQQTDGGTVTVYTGKGFATMRAASDADVAACQLAIYWPEKFTFDPSRTASFRHHQIIELQNVVRHGQGKPALPTPELTPKVVRSDAQEIPQLVESIRLKSEGWREDVDKLAALGMGALPAMNETLVRLVEDHAAREPLAAAALKLSNQVTEVTIAASASKLPEDLCKRLQSLNGRQMTATLLVELMLAVGPAAAAKQGAVALHLERTGCGGGTSLRVEMVVDQSAGVGSTYSHQVTADGASISGGRPDIREGLATPAGKSVEIMVKLQLY